MIVYFFRNITKRDISLNDEVILTSSKVKPISNTEIIQEGTSHILSATTKRRIFFSFSSSLELVEKYWKRNRDNVGICFLKIDTDNVSKNILTIFPAYIRKYWIYEIAKNDYLMKEKMILDPATGRKRSILGLLQPAQRSVSSWSSSMNEILIQCKNLKLQSIEYLSREELNNISASNDTNIKKFFGEIMEKPAIDQILKLKKEIIEEVIRAEVKNKYLVNKLLPEIEKELRGIS